MGLARRVLVLAAIEAVQLVVEDAAKGDPQRPLARLQRALEAQTRALVRRLQLGLAGDGDAAALGAHLVDFQFERVEHDLVGRADDSTATFSSPANVNAVRSGVRLMS